MMSRIGLLFCVCVLQMSATAPCVRSVNMERTRNISTSWASQSAAGRRVAPRPCRAISETRSEATRGGTRYGRDIHEARWAEIKCIG